MEPSLVKAANENNPQETLSQCKNLLNNLQAYNDAYQESKGKLATWWSDSFGKGAKIQKWQNNLELLDPNNFLPNKLLSVIQQWKLEATIPKSVSDNMLVDVSGKKLMKI